MLFLSFTVRQNDLYPGKCHKHISRVSDFQSGGAVQCGALHVGLCAVITQMGTEK